MHLLLSFFMFWNDISGLIPCVNCTSQPVIWNCIILTLCLNCLTSLVLYVYIADGGHWGKVWVTENKGSVPSAVQIFVVTTASTSPVAAT